jgi:hypothetical protein
MSNPMCLRLPDDLQAAVAQMAAEAGVTTSEWIRDLLFRTVYGEPLGVNDGYLHGRSIGYRVAVMAYRDTLGAMPETVEAGLALIEKQKTKRRG